jgi:hypothetical protein
LLKTQIGYADALSDQLDIRFRWHICCTCRNAPPQIGKLTQKESRLGMADTALANRLAPVDIQSARPEAHESAKAGANVPTNRIDQKHSDNSIGKILPFSILEALYR